jgi:aminomethyltransferase
MTATDQTIDPIETPLSALHARLGGKMVPFAGYALPVQYPAGVMAEHLHTRTQASLFDVSHMGQVIVAGPDAAAALERLIPADIVGLADGRQRYGLLTNALGGIEDDLMIARHGARYVLVLNAARKAHDLSLLRAGLDGTGVTVTPAEDRALIALQGPASEAVLAALAPSVATLRFMDVATVPLAGVEAWASRSGYTGEDGFEISVPASAAEALADALLQDPKVKPAGLGARDSLRLEAGLCLYGQDMNDRTTPSEAALGWAIPGVRRAGGARAGRFPGAEAILDELSGGAAQRRVGLKPEGRAPMRAGVMLFADENADAAIGHVTSGGFGPTLGAPVAMAMLPAALADPGTRVWGEMRGKRYPAVVAAMPFIDPRYRR